MNLRAFHHSHRINTIITSSLNNNGLKKCDKEPIITINYNALKDSTIPIKGDGKNTRDWLFVLDYCKFYLNSI